MGVLERGVWQMPWKEWGGGVLLVAIDSQGRRVTSQRAFPGEDVAEITAMVERILDQEDPPVVRVT